MARKCSKCSGKAIWETSSYGNYGSGKIKCPRCNGKGYVKYKGEEQRCDECQGQGEVTCPKCGGTGQVE